MFPNFSLFFFFFYSFFFSFSFFSSIFYYFLFSFSFSFSFLGCSKSDFFFGLNCFKISCNISEKNMHDVCMCDPKSNEECIAMVETGNECQDEAYMSSHGKLATKFWCMSGLSPSNLSLGCL